ncbi:MAG: calcium-binding protein, partial [Aestuariivirga sp.]
NTFTIAASGATDAFNQQVQTAALNDGRFVTVWLDSAGHIQGRAMFADGTPDGNVFEVSATTAGGRPTIATLADGRFAVTWEQGAFGATQVKSAVFDPREARISQSATSFNDDWNGTAFGDTLFMGTGNDIARGGGAADFIFGEAGNDRLYGEDSDDRIDGGTGADTMIGGIGNDYYFVDNANDDVQEFFNEGIDTIRSSVSYQLGSDEDKLYITGAAANGIGNSLSNFIFGNANANVLDGLGGADRLYGLQGDDQYVVDSAGDLVFETIAGASGGLNDQVFSAVNHTLSNNVEKLTLIGGGNINGTGNSLINAIGGNGGNNFIDGKAGSDTLTGNGGSDQFLFTTTLNATTNTDTITDFDPANDFLRLDDAIFAQIAPGFLAATAFELGSVADTAGDRIVYNPATGDVFYDRDGVGGAAQVKFANVGAGTALTQADIFVF